MRCVPPRGATSTGSAGYFETDANSFSAIEPDPKRIGDLSGSSISADTQYGRSTFVFLLRVGAPDSRWPATSVRESKCCVANTNGVPTRLGVKGGRCAERQDVVDFPHAASGLAT